jgi:hypothetical protein
MTTRPDPLFNPATAMFARHDALEARHREDRAYTEQWPANVEESLFKLASAIADLRDRVDAMEAKLGADRG